MIRAWIDLRIGLFGACMFALLSIKPSLAQENIRAQEIAQCSAAEIVTWQDGRDRPSAQSHWRFAYRHQNAPAWLRETNVRRLIERALQAWSACQITLELLDEPPATDAPDLVRLEWDDAGSRGNFGLSDLGNRRLWLSPAAFALLRSRNPGYDQAQTLQMVLSHELGHFLGMMAHSRRCVDVLSYYHNGHGEKCLTREPGGIAGKGEYRASLPTACDIARCQAINGK